MARRRNTVERAPIGVRGEGAPTARLAFLGEAGFATEAGQLLEKMIQAIGLTRDQVHLAVLDAEAAPGVTPHLSAVGAEVNVVLGESSWRALVGNGESWSAARGRFRDLPVGRVLATWDLETLRTHPEAKREAWVDLQLVARTLGLKLPPRGGAR